MIAGWSYNDETIETELAGTYQAKKTPFKKAFTKLTQNNLEETV